MSTPPPAHSQEYSRRLGQISDAQLQAALERFDLGDFVRAEPIPFGLFGQNLFVTSTRGDFVLRGVPHYDWQFPTEQYFVERLHRETRVPVPYPYRRDPRTDIFGWEYVIMPRMPGLQLADPTVVARLDPQARRGIARALAVTLIEAQTLTEAHAGHYDPATRSVRPLDLDYRAWIVRRIRELLASARAASTHTLDSDVRWVEQEIREAAPALDSPYANVLVMEDYKEQNLVVERAGEAWRVSGVFDLMTAHLGDGEADLARPVGMYLRNREQPELADDFVAEFLRHRPPGPGFARRQRLYMLCDSLLIWEFWQRTAGGLPEEETLSFEAWARPFVEYWRHFETG